ncbi:MAG: class I adenylate-forming enzyme family protein [Limisphaerales bacterium]
MLYERWLQVARSWRTAPAILDVHTARSWTFADLEREADSSPLPQRVVHPAGNGAEFVLDVLRAWRHGRIVCPLDADQTAGSIPEIPRECVHLKLTSASTGVSRMVAFTAAQLAADADQIVETMGLRPGWPNVAVISLAHSYGYSNLVLPLLLHGIPLVVAESRLPEALRRACRTRPEVTLPAVPVLWRQWFEAGSIPANIRLAISAGAPLAVSLERAIHERHGLKIHNFYGSTECGGIAYDSGCVPRSSETWVGHPMRGVDLSVGADGCLEVRGASVGLGYVPPDTLHLGHGRYRSHDLVEVSHSGVSLLGRATDLINVAGRKVAPETIERAVSAIPGVAACLVFGVPEQVAGRNEHIVAIVAPSGDAASGLDLDRIRADLLQGLPAWQIPREWKVVEKIPANTRGKISRDAWRQRYLAGELESAGLMNKPPKGV